MLLPIEWRPEGQIRFLDQTRLPSEEVWVETSDYRLIAEAIRRLQVRGAPLIGIAAAYGLALAARAIDESDPARFRSRLEEAARELLSTRPTAVNLSWALARMFAAMEAASDVEDARQMLVAQAVRIHEQDVEANRHIGDHGAALLPDGSSVLTHCNTGSLATGGYGTALGVIRSARERGSLRHAYATETRPLLQGARLTAWELKNDGIPFTLIVDSAAGSLLRRGLVDAVVVGADRIAANGDVANKIGTYALAVLAHDNGVPFYVAAPTSSIDLTLTNGDAIPIEERPGEEVTAVQGLSVAPASVAAGNPAFDVTPAAYVSAIVTENGVARPPYEDSLARLAGAEAPAHSASGQARG